MDRSIYLSIYLSICQSIYVYIYIYKYIYIHIYIVRDKQKVYIARIHIYIDIDINYIKKEIQNQVHNKKPCP